MLIDPQRPVGSFLRACVVLAAGLTLALSYWTLTRDASGQHCLPGGGSLFGICTPNGRFLLTMGIWFALIFGALALPLVSMLILKRLRPPPKGD